MAIVATMPEVKVLACDDCDVELKPTAKAICFSCHRSAISEAAEDAFHEAKKEHDPAGKAIREWAARRQLLGQISKEVRAELELCADDIEVGHG